MSKNTIKSVVAGTLAGAIAVCTLPVIAKNIEAVMNSVNISVDGEVVAKTEENYVLQNGTKVPYSILYEGTTYLPIRKVSELLDVEIDWDNDTRTVLVETSGKGGEYDSWYGAPDFGEFYGIKEVAQVPTIRSTTHWYDVKNVSDADDYIELLEKEGFEKVEDGKVKPKFKVYAKDNIEVWLDLGMYTKLVYGVTVMDTSRPLVGREMIYCGDKENIPDFGAIFGHFERNVEGISYYVGDWYLWSSLPDYFSLLEDEGFTITSVNKSFYGKGFTLKKERSTFMIRFDGSEFSNIPAITIDC